MTDKSLHMDEISLGVCYYPEQWPESMMDDDMRRIAECGIAYIRCAEFSWSLFEPEENQFSYEYYDKVLVKAQHYGLKVIFCTPTATPPAWLTHRYPEVLNVTQDGTRFGHGMRRHYNYNSPQYRRLSARIVETIAAHYGGHPAIVGWQIDNEFNCEVDTFYSDADRAAFRAYVKEKYGTLQALNDAWGTSFWNQQYTDWEQVSLSWPTPSNSPNPHMLLDEKRFFSESVITFCAMQSEIIRHHSPGRFVTTNSVFKHLDKHALTQRCLDVMFYDSYPNFAYELGRTPEAGDIPFKDRWWSLNLSAVRSISKNFGIMEQQAGPGGWTNRLMMPSPKPGQLRLWTFQSIAHGADLISYFRWRTCTYGTEIYWHGINDYHNKANRRIEEVCRVSKDIKKLSKVASKPYRADVGLLRDYDNEWDGEMDAWYGPMAAQSESMWFKALQLRHIPLDVVQLEYTSIETLSCYAVLVYPHPAILTSERAALLEQYVRRGGRLIFGCRTGYKDINGRCLQMQLPGYAASLCGVHVKDYTLVRDDEAEPTLCYGEESVAAPQFNDILDPFSSETLAVFGSAYYAGEAAVTKRGLEAGAAYYHGAAFTVENIGMLLEELKLISPLAEWLKLTEALELTVRGEAAFVLNYSSEPQPVEVCQKMTELLSGNQYVGLVSVPAFEVMVFDLSDTRTMQTFRQESCNTNHVSVRPVLSN